MTPPTIIRPSLAGVLVLAALVGHASAAHANGPVPALHHVVIGGDQPRASAFTLHAPDGQPLVSSCANPCSLLLPDASLKLTVFNQDARVVGTTVVRTERNEYWDVSPPNRGMRVVGLVAGITGAAILAAGLGFAVLGSALPSHGSGGGGTDLIAPIAVGAALMTAGFGLFFVFGQTHVAKHGLQPG